MINKKHVLLAFLFALCVAGLYPYVTSRAESKGDNPQESAADISFNDPAHVFFFNYQAYLAQHGKAGETLETWQALPGPERARKVAVGEALLKKLHTDLLAKEKLSVEETELLQAVWGKREVAVDQGSTHHSVVAGEKSIPVERVGTVSKNLGSFQKNENWGQLFDGGQNSKAPGAVDVVGAYAKRGATALEVSPKTHILRPFDEAKVPPVGNNNNEPIKRTLPFAGGAILLAGAYMGYRKWRAKDGQTYEKPDVGGIVKDIKQTLSQVSLPECECTMCPRSECTSCGQTLECRGCGDNFECHTCDGEPHTPED